MKMGKTVGVFKTAAKDFSADSAPRLGASLAYYTIFSLSPLLIIVIAIAAFFLGPENSARDQLSSQISGLVGNSGADMLKTMMSQPKNQHHGLMATIIATVTLVLGASGVFIELQAALNTIWDVKQQPNAGIWSFIKHRLLSFAMVLTIGFLLLVSMVLTAGIAATGKKFGSMMPGFEAMSQALNFVASFGVITVLFACIFKFMPDAHIPWKLVWRGAAFTALLFAIGKFALGAYIGKNSAASAFGAAKSLVILLLWVYYSAQIMFFGAELTQAYAKQRGVKIVPKEHATIDTENTNKEESPTKGPQGAQPKTAPGKKPAPMPMPAPAYATERIRPVAQPAHAKPGFLMPALLLVAAILLPNARRHHS